MTFKIGMPVVQISPWREKDTAYSDVRFTECGVVYTIREIVQVRGVTALRFHELINPAHRYAWFATPVEQPFPTWNFRPAVSPKQQVSFTTGAPRDSRKWDNRRKRVEVMS